MALTDAAVRKAKPDEKTRKLYDERGLLLLVKPSGSKLWRLKYRFAGKDSGGKFNYVDHAVCIGEDADASNSIEVQEP